ncbi:hypothetical protein C3R30_21815, partial [Mycobacterium tuberculosis]
TAAGCFPLPAPPPPLAALRAAGVSVWLAALSRARLRSGPLPALLAPPRVVGVPPLLAPGVPAAGSRALLGLPVPSAAAG